METTAKRRTPRRRDAQRKAGLRLVRLWVPDTRLPEFAEECRRQCKLATEADNADTDIQLLLDDALAEVSGWMG